MLKLEVVTPEKRVVDAEVESVTVPTMSGEVGILPHHAPLISALRPGILSYSVKGAQEKLVVSGGFVEVSADTVAVLAETAETPEDIAFAGPIVREDLDRVPAAAATVEEAELSRDTADLAAARAVIASGR